MNLVTIYTDGASHASGDKPGGWAAILQYGEHERELSGWDPCTSNNRMELTAAIKGLRALKRRCRVAVYSDSEYVVKGMMQYRFGWDRKGWHKVKNPDLWKALIAEAEKHEVTFFHVRGHNGHDLNERCDKLAVAAKKAGMMA